MKALYTFVLAFALSACAGGKSYLADSKTLSSSGTSEADALLARNASLTDRAGKLPADQTGTVNGRLATNKSDLEGIKGELSGSPAKIETAEKGGKRDDAKKTYETQQASNTRLPAAKAELDKLEQEIKSLESKGARHVEAISKFTKKLSTGFNVVGNMTGIEAQLVAFIEDSARQVDKTTWFNFDRLSFKTNVADLDMEVSKDQLTNVAEILKAFPKVKLKVGGYTDNVGKPAANMKLSTARAKSVAVSLTALGAAATRLDPEGYGETHPECAANDTDACKQQNRRIALRVTAK